MLGCLTQQTTVGMVETGQFTFSCLIHMNLVCVRLWERVLDVCVYAIRVIFCYLDTLMLTELLRSRKTTGLAMWLLLLVEMSYS